MDVEELVTQNVYILRATWYNSVGGQPFGDEIMFMTMGEINEVFDGEWIYAVDCEEDHAGTILGGEVVIHSADHDFVFNAMCDYDENVESLTLFRYAGRIPEGISILL